MQTEEHAQQQVVALIPDVFFAVTVSNAVRSAGFQPSIVRTADALFAEGVDAGVALVVVDLSAVNDDGGWAAIGGLIERDVPVLAFGPHRDVERLRRAQEVGVTRVMANSQFHRDMSGMIARYARSMDGDSREVEE